MRRLLIEEGADIIKRVLRLGADRPSLAKVTMIASAEGGMNIEVAHHSPEKILTVFIDPADG